MAHIAKCLGRFDPGSVSRTMSPIPSEEVKASTPSVCAVNRTLPFRMQPAEQQRKYQIFPREVQVSAAAKAKALDPEAAFAYAMQSDKQSATAALKPRINPQRRRKISIPENCPMTTVQETSMDSPTIPGRPPLHERSISAPGGSTGSPRHPSKSFLFTGGSDDEDDDFLSVIDAAFNSPETPTLALTKQLPPLVIPETAGSQPRPKFKNSFTHARSGSTPTEISRRNAAGESPRRRNPVTPSTDLTTPVTGNTNAISTAPLPTPVSAPALDSHKYSPQAWERRCMTPATFERTTATRPQDSLRTSSAQGHRRGGSESSGIMDRGRPRKRNNVRTQPRQACNGSGTPVGTSAERKAFEELPEGWKPRDAADNFCSSEALALHKQAVCQAERFEVLKSEDVEALSKELRHLDERTEYLRRSYQSLRAGRRNLHARVCQVLRSQRTARFSYESMLKQEGALAELDASIEEWVTKLERAENRRTRVRQKLLEHVAAAAILPIPDSAIMAGDGLGQTSGRLSAVCDVSTPPRSPSGPSYPSAHGAASTSPSPTRVVAQVPSTIFENPEDVVSTSGDHKSYKSSTGMPSPKRADVESIRVYAGDDVYALFADVENEISKMSGSGGGSSTTDTAEAWPHEERVKLHRQKSHEMLNGLLLDGTGSTGTHTAMSSTTSLESTKRRSPKPPTPPAKDDIDVIGAGMHLTRAVFRG